MDLRKQTVIDFLENTDDAELVTSHQIDRLIKQLQESIIANQKEISLCEKRIKNLETKKSYLKYGDYTVVFELADKLWSKHEGHEGVISFNWDTFNPDNADNRPHSQYFYYAKAKAIITKAEELGIGINKAIKLVTI